MKVFYLAFIHLFLLLATKGFSQNNQPINVSNYISKAQAETNRLKASLNLTDVQYQKVLEINKDYFKKLADIRTSDADNPALRRQKLDELNKKREDELKRNLIDWQFTKYINKIDSIRHQMTGH